VVLGCVGATDHIVNEEDAWIVSELIDQIRDVLSDYQVSLYKQSLPPLC